MLHHNHNHNHSLVILSIVIAIFASYTALDLANSLSISRGKIRWVWLGGGSLAMGVGIWSMHFIGMLAFSLPGVPIFYDTPLLVLSIIVAIAASALTLHIVTTRKASIQTYSYGSLGMGAAIAGMHYVGIWSMRMGASVIWNLPLVALSILIAIFSSFMALVIAFRLKEDVSLKGFLYRIAGGVFMGFAIAGMHYTAMAAMDFVPQENPIMQAEHLLASTGLASAVIIATLIILGIALTGSNIDRALSKKTIMTEALTNALRLRDEFLSVASHELKTPLTSIKLQIELIRRNIKNHELDIDKTDHMLEQTNKSIDRITRLVDDMLDISRLSTGKLKLQIEEFSLKEVCVDVLERLKPLLDNSNCPVIFEEMEGLVGEWDRFRIEQVITNLLTNAARYGAGKPITIILWREDGQAKLSVKDQGKGIDLKDHDRIFQRYERAESGHEQRGLGLGLFIVKGIVEMHNGQIEVESKLNEGACFTMTLPMRV